MSNPPVPPATCPVCQTPINRLRIAVMGGGRPRINCKNCGTVLRPHPTMHRIWSILSFIVFFGLLLLIIRVARFIILLKVVLIMGVGVLMLAFYSSFMTFEKAS